MYRVLLSLFCFVANASVSAADMEQLVPGLASRLDGGGANAQVGAAVAGAGDFNGDGFRDVLIGAPGAARGATTSVGAAYVIYGTAVGVPNTSLGSLTAASGVAITSSTATAGTIVGLAVAGADDFNGDGFADILVGSAIGQFGANQPGRAWLVFGRAGAAAIDLASLGSQGMTLTGAVNGDGFGTVLAGGGSFNGDALGDVALAAPFGPGLRGEGYVIYGSAAPAATLSVSQLDGSTGTVLSEPESFNLTGVALALDGDSNGDGRADLLIGAFGMIDGQQRSVGGAYLVHGRSTGAAAIDLGSLTGTDGTRFVGQYYSLSGADSAGSAVGFLGDQDGDGKDELLIADPDASPVGRRFAGEVFVVKGKTDHGAERLLATLSASDGVRIQGASAGDKTGTGLAGRADVNRDGRSDIAIAAPQTTDSTPLGPGRVAVLFDLAAPSGAIDLLALTQQRRNGELLVGNSGGRDFGTLASVCRANCSGATLVIGAAATDAYSGAGYVLGATDRVFFGGFD